MKAASNNNPEVELTGNIRARQLGDNLVLQVEGRFLHTFWAAGQIDSEWLLIWRDARVEDLTHPALSHHFISPSA